MKIAKYNLDDVNAAIGCLDKLELKGIENIQALLNAVHLLQQRVTVEEIADNSEGE
jgi:hypothetical protein